MGCGRALEVLSDSAGAGVDGRGGGVPNLAAAAAAGGGEGEEAGALCTVAETEEAEEAEVGECAGMGGGGAEASEPRRAANCESEVNSRIGASASLPLPPP